MNLRRSILKPVAYVGGLHASAQSKAFMAAHHRTRAVQDELLTELIHRHTQTDFGRDHKFAAVKTYEDFKAAVPVGSYETLRPYVDRVLRGQTSALIPDGEKLVMFSMTSGTTGKPKYIPVTERFAGHMRRGWNIFGLNVLSHHPDAWLRHILQISSPMRDQDSPAGLPCGAISGLLAATQKKIVRRMYVVPPEASGIADPAWRYYTILRCGVDRDVAIITTANPSSTLKLFEVGQSHLELLLRDVADGTLTIPCNLPAGLKEGLRLRPNPALARRIEEGVRRDGRLLPRHFWKVEFLTNWTGGTLKLYLKRLRDLFDGVPVRDIGLLASEGRFSIPLADDTAAGLAEITANFLEFIPAELYPSVHPPTLRADELEIGRKYFLVVTNWAGLWRYSLDDCIRVVDRLGGTPIFEFLHRGVSTANITGEKITEHQVVEAMRLASAKASLHVERFWLQGHFADLPYYQLHIEGLAGPQAKLLAGLLDEGLSQSNIEYHSKRSTGRLGPIRPVVLGNGQMERREQDNILRRRGRSEQYKHQYLLTEVVEDSPSQPQQVAGH